MPAQETVFLSSVAQGLEPYRDAVYQAVEGLDGFHCTRMEEFGARDSKSDAVCETKISECTIFVGIVGIQYGTIEEGTGKSYSEMEYDIAERLGKKRLMFVAPEDFPVQAHFIESDIQRERQRTFRQRVKQDRHVAFFTDGDELGRKVLQAIHNSKSELTPNLSIEKSGTRKAWLRYPFVTCLAGYDTGISVSNVSLDPLGSESSAGAITIWFYGGYAPAAPLRTTVLHPGQTFVTILSKCAPGFQGYIIVECDFSPARGFAMLISAKIGLASGYLAEVIEMSTSLGTEKTVAATAKGAP